MTDLALQLITKEKKEKTGKLDLGKCGLTELPEELFELEWLEELVVSNNWWDGDQHQGIESSNKGPDNRLQGKLSNSFINFRQLKKLYLGGDYNSDDNWEVDNLSILARLTKLQYLNLSNNQIKDISFLANLTALYSLYLINNQISDINALKKLIRLKSLYLIKNSITDISHLKNLTNLQSIDLTGNEIPDINPLANLSNLQSLVISFTFSKDYKSLKNLTSLKKLEINESKISNISFLANLTSLTNLYLSNNQIKDIRFLEKLYKLKILILSGNQIKDIRFLGKLTNLQFLDLSGNQIKDVRFLGKLTNLQFLRLSSNQIEDIRFLANLTNLQSLDLYDNQIEDIRFLEKLISLQRLYLNKNPITDLTHLEGLVKLRYLKGLYMHGIQDNNLNIPPEQFGNSEFDNCLENLKAYFVSIEKGTTRTREVPVILVGNTTAGKTSLLEFIRHQVFPPATNHSTHGIVPVVWEPPVSLWEGVIEQSEDETFQFYFWDFGGQEYYHATHRLFFSQQAIYVLLWEQNTNVQETKKLNIRLKKPDNTIEESEIPVALFPYTYWLQTIRSYAHDAAEAPVIMVQNKLDVAGNKEKEHLGGDFRQQYGISEVFHLSIQDAFDTQPNGIPYRSYESFLQHLLLLSKDHINTLARQTEWEGIKTTLQQRKGENIWMKAEFLQALQALDADIKEDSMLSYGQSLHAMGFIFYYPNDSLLGEHVFINPEWVVAHIYGILDDDVLTQGGKFDQQKVVDQLGDEYADLFIALMKKFELIFEHEEEAVFIAPQYLPETCTDKPTLISYQAVLPEEASLIVHFPEFMPPSLIQRLIVAFGDKAIGKVYWKYGGLFLLENQHVLIESQPEERNLTFKAKDHNHAVLWSAFQELRKKTNQDDQLYISLDNGKNHLKITDILEQKKLGNQSVKTLAGESCSIEGYTWLFDVHKPQNTIPMEDQKKVLKVFISYSHDDIEYRKELQTYLINLERDKIIEIWQDSQINPGEQWDAKIKTTLEGADIIILLVSQSFIASNYVHEVEMRKSLKKVEEGSTKIIPVLLKNCDWKAWKVLPEDVKEEIEGKKGSMGSYQFFPMDENQRLRPVNRWEFQEDVWTKLADYIRKLA